MVAGSSTFVTPQATVAAMTPACLIMTAAAVIPGVVLTLFRVEPHRRSLEQMSPLKLALVASPPAR